MKKTVVLILKIVGGIVAACVALLLALIGILHTSWIQDKAVQQVNVLLQEELKTKVEIGGASISLFGQDLRIYDVAIEDLQQRKMLQMKELGVELDLWKLLNHEVYITEAHIKGLDTKIYKPASPTDSTANFQFIIDAINKNKKSKKPKVEEQTDSVKKHKLTLDVEKLDLEQINVTLNDSTKAELGGFHYRKSWRGHYTATIKELKAAFVQHTKKGPVDSRLRVKLMEAVDKNGEREVTIDSLFFFTNNHLPRKNANKPKRGFFDAGHFDIAAHMRIHIDSIGKDTVMATLAECNALDRGSGLNITSLTARIAANKEKANLSNVTIKMPNTTLSFDKAVIQLPSKKAGRKLSYQTSLIKGSTLLKDISRPFAPVLKKFSIPLYLQTVMSGNNDGMQFRQVKVYTANRSVDIQASGRITGLKDKYKLNVHFDVHRMTTTGKEAERIINQFAVKKFMMKQLNALGRISYNGHFEVLWKREQFAGRLYTIPGSLDFRFHLDENNKYVLGSVKTDSFELGKAMDMPDLGKIACSANFQFDISKPRTAAMRKRLGGKLPIGQIEAQVDEGRYKKMRVRNLTANITSNGAIAEGKVVVKGKRVDLLCSFSFTNTNEMKKTKIKPGVRFHGLSDEDKEAKAAKKAAKKEEKAARKAAKQEEKAARKAAKQEEKAAKKAAKEVEKAQRRAEKDSLKAVKSAAKAARKAQKDSIKAARKAAAAT